MIRNVLKNIFIIISVLIALSSCKNKKAEKFDALITAKESRAFSMLVGEKGLETIKLNQLIAQEYGQALHTIDQQELVFDSIINDIKKADIVGLLEGKEVQLEAINYYRALKDLFMFSRREIVQEKLMHSGTKEQQYAAQDQLLVLARQKQVCYQQVYKSSEKLHAKRKKFEAENGLK
ncbi:hypothetical protein [Sphingobacterium sp. HMA12]|uniref:hypothetical protein n=1 Tax=Sphingobacterium sp. HMA12 TaxID=2050894 RepID=UPI000CEA320D|nr:hypothetical protein [Sphingobacterium sp. HMA12]